MGHFGVKWIVGQSSPLGKCCLLPDALQFLILRLSNSIENVRMKRTGAASKRQQKTVIYDCVERLRNAIMAGKLRPGQKLIEASLCESMTVSRPSLREALRVLEADGLIELFPNRGPSVARLGVREIEEIHDVWAMLTGEAVYRFAKAANANDIRDIELLIGRLKSASRADDPMAMLTWTNGIFGTIFSKCDNHLLIDMVYSLVARINFLRAQSLVDKAWRRQWVADIEEMIATIRTGTPHAAREAVRHHIASACDTAKRVGPISKNARIPKSRLLSATPALAGGMLE